MRSKNSELWRHPTLPIFDIKSEESPEKSSERLYLIPTLDTLRGEEIDPDFLPTPTSKLELPNVQDWVRRYVIGVVEIWSSQRPAMQLARWSHRKVFRQLTNPSPIANGAKIFRIHTSEPINGVIEATITLSINQRFRSLALRFEGVDKRWLCTEMLLI